MHAVQGYILNPDLSRGETFVSATVLPGINPERIRRPLMGEYESWEPDRMLAFEIRED